MPQLYRPESDRQRIQALHRAKAKYESTAPSLRAFSQAAYDRLTAFISGYETRLRQRGTARSTQTAATAAIRPQRRKLQLYISHFLVGLNNAILRQEVPAAHRAYYQLEVGRRKRPLLNTDIRLVQWAQNIISGEAKRVAAGGTAMTNPTAAQVEAQLNIFVPLQHDLTTAKDAYDSSLEAVADQWAEADDIIADVWDEVLFHFRKDRAPSKRRKAREWGVVYLPTRDEKISPEEFSAHGTVVSLDTRRPLREVEVLVVETGLLTNTDRKGRYLVGLLPPGTYTLRFSLEGHVSQEVELKAVDGKVIGLNVELAKAD